MALFPVAAWRIVYLMRMGHERVGESGAKARGMKARPLLAKA
ncbi:hypothetical protein [Burkholderia sp. F1]